MERTVAVGSSVRPRRCHRARRLKADALAYAAPGPGVAGRGGRCGVATAAENTCSRTAQAVAAAATVALLSFGMSPAWSVDNPDAYGVPRVVDGDTLVFPAPEKQRVRLKALDAFETKQYCKDGKGEEYLCGIRAKEAMEKIVHNGNVRCVSHGNDVFGRMVGTCTNAEGVDIGAEIVAEGWALSFQKFGKEYVAAEDAAQKAKRGAWAGSFQEPWEYRRAVREERKMATSDSATRPVLSGPSQ